MPIISRSFDDLLLDVLVTRLRAFSAAQAAMDASVAFHVERDQTRPPTAAQLPLVVVYIDALNPETAKSGGRTRCHDVATVNADLIIRGAEAPAATGQNPVAADQVAMRRMYYLKEQVRYCLFDLVGTDFGFAVGTIAKKAWPRWTLNPERALQVEDQLADGRWQFEVEYEWSPGDVTGVPLEMVSVDTGLWAAQFPIGGEP